MQRILGLAFVFLALAAPVRGCDLALLFAVDVSGSVDPVEYDIQMQGLADALRDPSVADALIAANARLALLQWTGASRQRLTVQWTSVGTRFELERFASQVAEDPRAWRNFSTAIGEALVQAQAAMARVNGCTRRVIDISGDGVSNEGPSPRSQGGRLSAAGITVNALVIEDATDGDLTGYFFENVISGAGAFVETANGFRDYPRAMKRKLRREVVEQTSALR